MIRTIPLFQTDNPPQNIQIFIMPRKANSQLNIRIIIFYITQFIISNDVFHFVNRHIFHNHLHKISRFIDTHLFIRNQQTLGKSRHKQCSNCSFNYIFMTPHKPKFFLSDKSFMFSFRLSICLLVKCLIFSRIFWNSNGK